MSDVSIEIGDDRIAEVRLTRPPNNHIDADVMADLADQLHSLDADDRCWVFVLGSEGRHFSAGASFGGDRQAFDPNQIYRHAARLFTVEKPIVAAVQGAAVGAGLGLALVADFRVASPESRFSANFARLGLHHGFGLSETLPSLVGGQTARDLLYTGRRVTGTEAHRLGLCDRLVPAEEIWAAARELALEVAASAPLAVRAIRATLRGDLHSRVLSAMEREADCQRTLHETADFVEGVRAMAARRPPQFDAR